MQYMRMWRELGVLKVGGLWFGLLLCGIQLPGDFAFSVSE